MVSETNYVDPYTVHHTEHGIQYTANNQSGCISLTLMWDNKGDTELPNGDTISDATHVAFTLVDGMVFMILTKECYEQGYAVRGNGAVT